MQPYRPQEQESVSGEDTSSGEGDIDEEDPVSTIGSTADVPSAGSKAEEGRYGKATLPGILTDSPSFVHHISTVLALLCLVCN